MIVAAPDEPGRPGRRRGAVAAASLLTFGLGVVLAPGEAVAPGVVLLVGGAAVLVAGIALIVLVMRMLLAQAVARDTEAHHLQAELDEIQQGIIDGAITTL